MDTVFRHILGFYNYIIFASSQYSVQYSRVHDLLNDDRHPSYIE